MVVRRRGATWCLWSAVLAAMPYFRASLDAPSMVVALGQAGDVPVAVALLAVLVWGVVRSGCDESRPAYVIRRIVELIGLVATAALVVVEVVLCANRGILYLDDTQVLVYEAIGALEAPLSAFALTGWAIWGSSLGATPNDSHVPLLGAFAVGALWPCLCVLGVASPWWQSAVFSVIAGALSAVLALLAARILCIWGASPGAVIVPFLSGQLAFVLARSTARQIQWDYLDELLPTPALYAVFAAVIVIYVVALRLALSLRRRSRRERVMDEHEMSDEASIAGVFQGRSEKSLTERELAVLVRTVRGETASIIAAELGIAEATVATYRRRGYEKLHVKGAKELCVLAADIGVVEGTAVEKQDMPKAGAMPSYAALRFRFSYVFLPFALVVFPVLPWPEEVEVALGYWVSGVGTFAALGLSLAGVLIATALYLCVEVRPGECGREPLYFHGADYKVLGLVLVGFLWGSETYFIWSDYCDPWLYYGLVFASFLDFAVWRAVRRKNAAGVYNMSADEAESNQSMLGTILLALAVAPVISVGTELTDPCLFFGPYLDLINLLAILMIVYMLWAALNICLFLRRHPHELTNRKSDRVIHYLLGRGLGEPQAQVLLDLVSGYGIGEVAVRRCTTVATVRSYRQRSYIALGVHSMSELRELLSCEAGFTCERELHPVK